MESPCTSAMVRDVDARLFLAVSALLASCATPPPPSAPTVETRPAIADRAGDGAWPGLRVVLEGNALVPSAELLAVLRSDRQDALEGYDLEDLLQRDVLLLSAAYYDRGYLEVRVDPPVVDRSAASFVDVRFRIHEGIRYRIRTLTVEERDANGRAVAPVGTKKLRERMTLRPGDVFARDVFIRDLMEIQTLYHDASYSNVDTDVKTDLDRPKAEVDVTLTVKRNESSVIEHVLIDGNRAVDTDAIRKEIGIADGERYSETRLVEAKARLLGLGKFRRVDVSSSSRPSVSRLTITFEVEEK
jgi:outer membrane protein insertion porin family